jgi:hypothetical protein
MAQQYEDLRIVRERALGQGDFRSGIVVIEIAPGEVLGSREMPFARVGPQMKGSAYRARG